MCHPTTTTTTTTTTEAPATTTTTTTSVPAEVLPEVEESEEAEVSNVEPAFTG